jgi:hypothetical protein
VLLWVLWFFFNTIARRADLVAKDSPLFRAALDVWSPLIMAVMNTPRGAKRFLNRVRYLAMRQRALFNEGKPSLLDRLCTRVSRWFVSDTKSARVGEPATAPAGAAFNARPRSLGAAAATPATASGLVNIPESLLVALAAIQQVPGAWAGLLTSDWKNVPPEYQGLLRDAVKRHEEKLRDWDSISSYARAFEYLCSEVTAR